MDKKTHILAWKDEGVTSEKMAKQLGRHKSSIDRLEAKAGNLPSLVTSPPAKRALEDHVKWTRPFRQNSKDRSSSTL